MNSNGKLIAAVTVIIAVMVVSVSLTAAQAPREQDDNGASLSNGAPISDHDLVIYLLGAKDLDKDKVISSALTKLALLLVPQIRILNLSIGDQIPADIEVTLMDGSTATFHMLISPAGGGNYNVTIDHAVINDSKTVDLNLAIAMVFTDDSHITLHVKDGATELVTFYLVMKEGVKDHVSSVRVEILGFELPNMDKVDTNQIVYLQFSGDELENITFIFPDNEHKSAVVLHYNQHMTKDKVVHLDLQGIVYESNVIYSWCGTFILRAEIMPMD